MSEQFGSRSFFTDDAPAPRNSANDEEEKRKKIGRGLLDAVRSETIGDWQWYSTPYQHRRLVYCDYVASGRAFKPIERYIADVVLPLYGNTHTTTSVCGRQSTFFRHEARQLIKGFVGATEEDALIFCGSGATAAANKLCRAVVDTARSDEVASFDVSRAVVVFIGPYAHHSSMLPWRDSGATVVHVDEGVSGGVNERALEASLRDYARPGVMLVGVFAAASNVTGVTNDENQLTMLMHKYHGIALWDFATAAPYAAIDMNPIVLDEDPQGAFKDAVFFSAHKFLGGVGGPGVLIAKRRLFESLRPAETGGGTIFYVQRALRYLKEVEEREEAGTPDIVGSIRAALAMQLKETIGVPLINDRESHLIRVAFNRLSRHRNIILLGPPPEQHSRLAVVSLLVRHQESGLFLHHNFVSALLNDLFGIQTRGGCMCAGPYAQELLGIDSELSEKFERDLLASSFISGIESLLPRERDRYHFRGRELLRPGFVRLNFHYGMNDKALHFVLEALEFVATHGWKLLPQYRFIEHTGECKHVRHEQGEVRHWLGRMSYSEQGNASWIDPAAQTVAEEWRNLPESEYYAQVLAEAAELVARMEGKAKLDGAHSRPMELDEEIYKLRWFMMPSEAEACLLGEPGVGARNQPPFTPKRYGHSQDEVVGAERSATSAEAKPSVVEDQCVEERVIKHKFHNPPKNILRPTIDALQEYSMVQDGDGVLVCVSGGKDSLSLVHVMYWYQQHMKSQGVNFRLGAITVDVQVYETFDPRPLIPYFQSLGLPYFQVKQPILQQAKEIDGLRSICSFCSRMKRGVLYEHARREGYNVLAMGHHLDDLAESFLMSAMHNGFLRTMKACYLNREEDLRIIRPFVYTRERALRTFSIKAKLPVVPESCPACFTAPTERERTKQLLAQQEHLFPNVMNSIRRAIQPLMAKDRTGIESESSQPGMAMSRKAKRKQRKRMREESAAQAAEMSRPSSTTECNREVDPQSSGVSEP